ncbi:MAG: hypothetical protein ACRDV4_05310 [Acidimicrobiales bacterium]
MRHATEGELRRLDDEPLAIPDRTSEHVATCPRCITRRTQVAHDTERIARALSGPQLVPDVDAAWARLLREVQWPSEVPDGTERRRATVSVPRHPRIFRVSMRAGLLMGVAGIVIAGTAAATTITTVFAPTKVTPLSLSQSDLQSMAAFMGLGNSHVLGGFATPSGSRTLPFGTIKWSSSGPAERVGSLAQASAEAGFRVSLPNSVPSGVGSPEGFMVQPRVSATVTFDAGDQNVGGSSVSLYAGPAVLVAYGSKGGGGAGGLGDVPTLAVLTLPRPTGVAQGASMSQIEAFLLSQHGVSPELAEEIRLLGDLGTTLPVPVPPGASVSSVQIAGSPGVLVSDASGAVAGVVWEDGAGMLHVVAGILDPQSVLNVADQLG